MKSNAMVTVPVVPQQKWNAVEKFDAKNLEAVAAEVIPEHITANATRNVRNCTPQALWTYSAAPAAWGYLVTNSR